MGKFKVGDRVYAQYWVDQIEADPEYPILCRSADRNISSFTNDGKEILDDKVPSLKTIDEVRQDLGIAAQAKPNFELELENAYLKGQIDILLKVLKNEIKSN